MLQLYKAVESHHFSKNAVVYYNITSHTETGVNFTLLEGTGTCKFTNGDDHQPGAHDTHLDMHKVPLYLETPIASPIDTEQNNEWKIGEIAKVVGEDYGCIDPGSIVQLIGLDQSPTTHLHLWHLISGKAHFNHGPEETPGAFLNVQSVRKITCTAEIARTAENDSETRPTGPQKRYNALYEIGRALALPAHADLATEALPALKMLQAKCFALSAENEKLDDALSCQMSLLDEYSYARTLDDRDIRAYLMKLYTEVSPRGAFNKKKALWKAEVLEEVAESLIAKHETSAHGMALILGAVELRQQAENYREK